MKLRLRFLFSALFGIFTGAVVFAQQQPVLSVSIADVAVLSNGSPPSGVVFVDITNPGSGYLEAPGINVIDPPGFTGESFEAKAVIDLTGRVTNVIITKPGSGYSSPPTMEFTAIGTMRAVATAYVGVRFPQPSQNESYGVAGVPIAITAQAVGTFPVGGFTYEFFVNGVSIGIALAHPAAGTPASIAWTPPQPGAYFLTVTASDGAHTATSLPVRYFATGTMITSPTPNTIVPNQSSVVLQAAATPRPLTGGNGYTAVPTVNIVGGGGVGATATARIGEGIITSVAVTAGGGGYGPGATVTFTGGDPEVAATAVPIIGGGQILGITLTNGGRNYTSAPTVTIVGGGGAGATATATLNATVLGVDVTNAGTGYTSAPTISFTGGGGTGAAAKATISNGGVKSIALNSANAFVSRIEFWADGVLVGSDSTAPYSLIYTPANTPSPHTIQARAYDNNENLIPGLASDTLQLFMVPPIGTPPTCVISSPANNAILPIPLGSASDIAVAVAAGSATGLITKVELYIDGVLHGTATNFPYSFQWRPTVVGDYRLIALAYDDKSNVVASSIAPAATIVRVRASPTVTVTAPVSGAITGVGTPTLLIAAATDSNIGGTISKVQFFAGATLLGEGTLTGGNEYSFAWTPTAVGPVQITAIAFNALGLATSSTPIDVTVNSGGGGNIPVGEQPTVSITAPIASTEVPVNQASLITATAEDEDGYITSLEFFVSGKSIGKSSYPYVMNWTPQSLGQYTLTAQVTDNDGNVVTTAPLVVKVTDPSPGAPTVAVSVRASGGAVAAGNTVSLIATAQDDVAIGSVQFFVNGVPFGSPDTAYPYTVSWTPASPGVYTVAARAVDNVGNATLSSPVQANVTTGQAPVVTLTNPPLYSLIPAGVAVNLIATASDADGTVTSVRFLADGIVVGTATASPYTATWRPSASGTYALTAEATDNSGNITTTSLRVVTVLDNAVPQPRLTAPANSATVRVGVGQTLTATAADLDGVVTGVEFFVNGVSIGTSQVPPYKTQWTPGAEGVYRLTVAATDNAGAIGLSAPVLVSASLAVGDTVVTGTYQGSGEMGRVALVAATGTKLGFLAYSTTPMMNRTYAFLDVPLGLGGSFAALDDAGRTQVSGVVSDTGATGTFDAERLTFVGLDTGYFPAAYGVSSGYYQGKLTSRDASTINAIVGEDASITVRIGDAGFEDAGGGTPGMVDRAGAFSFVTMRGNRLTGKIDPATGQLTGTLSGTSGGAFTAAPAALGSVATNKILGAAHEVLSDVLVASTGRVYDQVLLDGTSASVTADRGQITRVSFRDLSSDIVQVEFSGAGRLTISLENASGPAVATNYNQPDVHYMKGHASIVITGADETTNVSVFSVGRLTAGNQALFDPTVVYDGVADIAYIAILSANGKFGGVRTANAGYLGARGVVGICAPGVQFHGPVFVGDLTASGTASPMLVLGSANDVRITGGDLWQANGKPVQVSGISQLKFVDGTSSHGVLLSAQRDRSRLEQDGVDVTAQVVVNPDH